MKGYANRGSFLLAGFVLIILIYIMRLFYLQVMSEDYAIKSQARDLEYVELYPSRGIIYDRNENIYVQNSPKYDVQFLPKEITIPDTSILEELLGIDRAEIKAQIKQYDGLHRYQWKTLVKQLDREAYSRFSEQMWQFGGMRIATKPSREYNYKAGAHFLGFINEIGAGELERAEKKGDTVDYRYRPGDLVGKIGIEKKYETLLRGKKGLEIVLKDNFQRRMGKYANGRHDIRPSAGTDIQLGIDAELQEFGEKLMQNKRGSVVALDPKTGEILAFVSAPTYDPSLLTGSELGDNFAALAADRELPLLNRPLTAQYPPGSIFKILQALAAMSQGVIDEHTRFGCNGAWFRNRGKPACHGAHGACDLRTGIIHSCNSYFAEVYYTFLNHRSFAEIHAAYQRWFDILYAYGVGKALGVDIPDEKRGLLPKKEFYDRTYGKKGWGALTIYSNSIGQGEILMTPLQMANTAAMIANRGWYYPPHFLKAERGSDGGWITAPYGKVKVPGVPSHYDMVVEAMEQVVEAGTARRARIDSIAVCGKTGTVENKAGEDHSVFMAFAPKENPKIAIAAIVENAGFGGTWSAPICSLMIEYYLKRKIKNDFKLQRILEAEFKMDPPEESGEAAPAPAPAQP